MAIFLKRKWNLSYCTSLLYLYVRSFPGWQHLLKSFLGHHYVVRQNSLSISHDINRYIYWIFWKKMVSHRFVYVRLVSNVFAIKVHDLLLSRIFNNSRFPVVCLVNLITLSVQFLLSSKLWRSSKLVNNNINCLHWSFGQRGCRIYVQ